MGSVRYLPDDQTKESVEKMIQSAMVSNPLFGYKIYPKERITHNQIILQGKTLETGNIITDCLSDSDFFAVFVVTAGYDFEQWYEKIKEPGDLLSVYIADAVGTEITEATSRIMIDELKFFADSQNMKISKSYSPGYCGWDVGNQKTLFSLLPPDPCNITLNTSCLMSPLKSISGIIGIGERVTNKPYGCSICNKKDCYKNKLL